MLPLPSAVPLLVVKTMVSSATDEVNVTPVAKLILVSASVALMSPPITLTPVPF